MNVGQILETHLGWACHTLGAQIGELVEEYRRTGARREDLLERLRDVYGEEEFRDQIANLDTDQLMEMCGEPEEGRADRHAGVRRRADVRHRRHAGARPD